MRIDLDQIRESRERISQRMDHMVRRCRHIEPDSRLGEELAVFLGRLHVLADVLVELARKKSNATMMITMQCQTLAQMEKTLGDVEAWMQANLEPEERVFVLAIGPPKP